MADTKQVKFFPHGMVTSYIVFDAAGKRTEMFPGDVVEVTVKEFDRLAAEFPMCFLEPNAALVEDAPAPADDDPEDGEEFVLDEMTVAQLKKFVEDNELDIPRYKTFKRDELINAIAAALEIPDGGEE
jgi:hypothetical protein